MKIKSIFKGNDLFVGIYDRAATKDTLIITFTSLVDTNHEKVQNSWNGFAQGFGENFSIKNKINTIFVVVRGNHWYEVNESNRMIEIIKNLPLYNQSKNIILYGTSMGGYATFLFSNRLKANKIIAAAPQVKVDKVDGLFDPRWVEYRNNISFKFDNAVEELEKFSGDIVLIYDPTNEFDTMHIDLIKESEKTNKILLKGTGHTPLTYLALVGLINEFMLNLIQDKPINKILKRADLINEKYVMKYAKIKKLLNKKIRKSLLDTIEQYGTNKEKKTLDILLHLIQNKRIEQMKPKELAQKIQRDNAESLGKMSEGRIAFIIRKAFEEIKREIEDADKEKVNIPGLGSFRIRMHEKEKGGHKETIKRIFFKPAQASKLNKD